MEQKRYPVVRLGEGFVRPEDPLMGQGYIFVPALKMAFESTGRYIRPDLPGWGRFPTLPPESVRVRGTEEDPVP